MRNEFTQYITLFKHNAQLKWNRLLLNQVFSFANAITCILPQLFSNFKSSRDRAEIPQWCTSRPLTSFFISCMAVVSLKGTLVEHLLTSAVTVELETFVCHHSLVQLVPFTLPCVARFLVPFWFLYVLINLCLLWFPYFIKPSGYNPDITVTDLRGPPLHIYWSGRRWSKQLQSFQWGCFLCRSCLPALYVNARSAQKMYLLFSQSYSLANKD